MATKSDEVRAFPYPVLEEGNLAFPDGEYTPDFEQGDDGYSAHVRHTVDGAPLIKRLVQDKQAVCGCTVSIPATGYRHLHVAEEGVFKQQIKWDRDQVGEPPFVRPLIVCCEAVRHTLSQRDGVHEAWIGREIELEKGTKIALGPTLRTKSSMQSLLSVKRDDSLEKGQMRVAPCTDEGFYFTVKVASDLYDFIQNPGGGGRSLHRRSILVHAASSCFALLAKDYTKDGEDEDGWRSYPNLRALAADMESKGLSTWEEIDDFCPELAATSMHPHRIPSNEEDE